MDTLQAIKEKINGGAKIIYLKGNLGAGKTTLVKKLLKTYGINESEIKSPTFALKRTHKTDEHTFHHIDLYRLDHFDLNELEINDEDIYLIEWAEKIQPNSKIKPDLEIQIDFNPLTEARQIKVLS